MRGGQFTDMVTDVTTLPSDSPLIYAMASCHSLIKLNGELTGNPLDVKVFESIEWELKEHFNSGVNPDYGVPTPTLVSPPKRPSRQSGQFYFLFLSFFQKLSLPSLTEIYCHILLSRG